MKIAKMGNIFSIHNCCTYRNITEAEPQKLKGEFGLCLTTTQCYGILMVVHGMRVIIVPLDSFGMNSFKVLTKSVTTSHAHFS